ncbi:DUF2479 domain-containing protein [Clostridium perfringens]
MKNIEIYNTLNIDKDSSSIVATFTQEDDAVMEFKLFKDGQEIVLKDQTISLGAERKDGAVIEQDDGFLIKENNVLNITLKKNIIQVVGVVKIQLYLKDKSGEMASNTFNIRVNKKLLGAENVEATNDIKVLNTLVLELKNNTNKLIDDTKSKADKLLSGLQETGDNLSATVKAKTDKVIEDTKAEVDNIKKDYEGLKKVVIDENIGIKLQKDITELQNGLKSNQALAYQGSSITANNTLESRTECMRISGRTLNNLYKANNIREDAGGKYILVDTLVKDEPKDRVVYIVNNTNRILLLNVYKISGGWDSNPIIRENSISKLDLTGKKLTGFLGMYDRGWTNSEADKKLLRNTCIVLDREETYIPQKYFEGLKSFGEAEQEGDKYKITILSHGKNLCDFQKSKLHGSLNAYITEKNGEFSYSVGVDDKVGWFAETDNIKINEGNYTISIEVKANLSSGAQKFWYGVYLYDVNGTYLGYRGTYVNTTNNYNRYNLSVDIPPNTSFCKFRVYNYSNIAGTITFKNPQLEEGTVATPYEPYKCDKKDILISAPLPGFDFGEDIMYEENGQVKITRNIDTYTFTGDETMRDTTEQDEKSGTGKYKVFVLTVNKTIDINKNINNNFPKEQFNVAFQNMDSEGLAVTQYGVYIKILKSKLSTQDTEGFKAWLKANQTVIYFVRATPVTEIVDNCVDIDLDTYQEKTYFNILNSLPGTLDFKVPSNIGSLVQSNAKEINNINEFINNFILKALLEMNKDLAAIKIKNGLN